MKYLILAICIGFLFAACERRNDSSPDSTTDVAASEQPASTQGDASPATSYGQPAADIASGTASASSLRTTAVGANAKEIDGPSRTDSAETGDSDATGDMTARKDSAAAIGARKAVSDCQRLPENQRQACRDRRDRQ